MTRPTTAISLTRVWAFVVLIAVVVAGVGALALPGSFIEPTRRWASAHSAPGNPLGVDRLGASLASAVHSGEPATFDHKGVRSVGSTKALVKERFSGEGAGRSHVGTASVTDGRAFLLDASARLRKRGERPNGMVKKMREAIEDVSD